ncbi:MAG: hypothetical protein IPN06_20140 [Burkholderiales bacterium]|nr:hypothetical protein [Burkholderiales bacterium]
MSTLADRAKGTAFEILYVVRVEPELTKEDRRRISQRDSHRRAAALRKAKALAEADNKQRANWTI